MTERSLTASLFVLLIPVLVLPQRSEPTSVAQIVKRQGPAVVLIEAQDARGALVGQASGIVLRRNGVIATNHHVLEGACELRVRFSSSDKAVPVERVISVDLDNDIALLGVSAEGLTVATLGSSRTLRSGDKVIAIGNPMGLERSVSEGIVSGFRKIGSASVIQITAPISPGSSGGGLYTLDGRLVGLTTFTLKWTPFARPFFTRNKLRSGGVWV